MDLFYEVQGKGTGSPILMIHSGGVDSRTWKNLAPALAESHQVITFDGRGTGHSPAPHAPMNIVEDMKSLLDHLNLASAVLIGHSMGGQAATEFALKYPEMTDRLILIAPALSGFSFSKAYTDWVMEVNSFAPDYVKMTEFSLQGPPYRVTMSGPHRDFFSEMHLQYMKRVFTEWRSFELIWPETPAIERLEQLRAETLFIEGTCDWEDISLIADEFKRVPSFRHIRIEGGDHMMMLTHGGEIAGHIKRFLTSS